MKKINFALVSDVLFFTLCAFIISFTAIRFYVHKAVTALVSACGIALAVGVIAFFVLYAKRKKFLIASLGDSEKKSLSLHLSTCNAGAIKSLFIKALDGSFVLNNRLQDEKEEFFFNFKMSPLSPDDIADVIRADADKPKRIFCCEISPAALSLAEDFSIKITTVPEIYALLKERKLLPEKYALGDIKKPNFFKRVKKRFNRKLCLPLFLCGFTLLFYSFFTFYPIYYTVAGGILLALSAASVLISQA